MSDPIKYTRIINAVMSAPWAILPAKLVAIQELLAYRAAGGTLTAEEIKERIEAAAPRQDTKRQPGKGVAVLSLIGVIIPRADLFQETSGAVSVERFTRAFRQALADEEVGSIVIDVDSPGGQVSGIPELASEIYNARGIKPITAVANSLAASAAYWVASAADEIVVTPSGEVGSIGVFAMHQDISAWMEKQGVAVNLIAAGRYKTEGNPYEALTDEGREYIQSRVDEYYDMFTGDVARNRGVNAAAVRTGFGEGRVVGADAALRSGMADRIATMDDVINELLATQAAVSQSVSADSDFRQRRLRAASR